MRFKQVKPNLPVGSVVGCLKILEYLGKEVKCQCVCGVVKNFCTTRIRNMLVRTCGCGSKNVDYMEQRRAEIEKRELGKSYGYLKVTDLKYVKGDGWCAVVTCECGKKLTHKFKYLKKMNAKSCGCKKKEIIKETCFKKYGASSPNKNPEVKKKIRETNLKRYGYENPNRNPDVRQKTINTNLERYGAIAPLMNPEIQKKQRQTNMERYGGASSMHSMEVYKKNLLSQRLITRVAHWETEEELICRGSYESRVVNYWNKSQIPFIWQVPFRLPSGCLYICDAYLPNENIYIEIKGFWRTDAQKKWAEFSSIYPNSEVWDKEKLKYLKIL